MTYKKLFGTSALMLAAIAVSGCGGADSTPVIKVQPAGAVRETQPDARVEVEVVGAFADAYAYNGRRTVYVVRDKKTGKEFVGVSGVGIAETGIHSSGKTAITDER